MSADAEMSVIGPERLKVMLRRQAQDSDYCWAAVLDTVEVPFDRDGAVVEYVRAEQLAGAVEAERAWCRRILDADKRDLGDGRLWATLANMADTRLRELEEQ